MISRNLCFSTFVRDNKYLNIENVKYENFKWDDKIEYKLNHTCEAIGKTGISAGKVCGKPAFFDVSIELQILHYKKEIQLLVDTLDTLDTEEDKDTIKKLKISIKKKEKELKLFTIDLFDENLMKNSKYYCRTHDPIKSSRLESEKYQKKDVSYDYTVVQPEDNVNKGVVPALLEELYAERKRVKREMAKAADEGNKLLADILDQTQLALKISLNSSYGFLGRKQGNLILKELGSIVTSVGRQLIEQSKEYTENTFLEYIKKNDLGMYKIKPTQLDTNWSKQELDIILEQFKVKETKEKNTQVVSSLNVLTL